MHTFVLVHGGFHGGWCWAEVAQRLRAQGHRVYTPTQTGLAERAHLLSKAITLDTFVGDITELLQTEDLHDVVLVGHSFGGITITGVAERQAPRLAKLVYLDSAILQSGQTMLDLLGPEVAAVRIAAAQSSGGLACTPPSALSFGVIDPAQQQFVQARLTDHPFSTYTSSLTLEHPLTNGVPAVYVRCIEPIYAGLQAARDWVQARGMAMVDIATGHDAMITAPVLLSDLLLDLASGTTAQPLRP